MSAVKGQMLDLRVAARNENTVAHARFVASRREDSGTSAFARGACASKISTIAQLDSAGGLAPLLDNYQI